MSKVKKMNKNISENSIHSVSTIVYDKSMRGVILQALDKRVDDDDYLIDSSGDLVLTSSGEQIKEKDFGGIIKGSEIYLKKDIDSLIKYLEDSPVVQ